MLKIFDFQYFNRFQCSGSRSGVPAPQVHRHLKRGVKFAL